MYIDDNGFHIQVFLMSVGFGFIVGTLYDMCRFLRMVFIKNNKAVFLQDILFFAVSAVLTFLFLLTVNGGRFRFYIFLALVLGFAVYYFTLGRLMITFGEKALRKIKHFFEFLGRIVSAPFRLFLKPFGKLRKKLRKSLSNHTKNLKIKSKPPCK